MKTEHTATPWGIEETDSTIWVGPLRSDGSGKIAEIVTYFDVRDYKPARRQKDLANARRIVACVNMMPEVEDALADAIYQMESDVVALDSEFGACRNLESLDKDGVLPWALKSARATLAKLKEAAL